PPNRARAGRRHRIAVTGNAGELGAVHLGPTSSRPVAGTEPPGDQSHERPFHDAWRFRVLEIPDQRDAGGAHVVVTCVCSAHRLANAAATTLEHIAEPVDEEVVPN